MISNFLKYLEYEKRCSVHTLIAYKKDLEHLESFLRSTFEITSFGEVEHTHLRNWIIHLMETGLSPRSVNRKMVSVKSFFKFLKARNLTDSNSASRLKPLKTEKRLPTFVKENDLMALLDRLNVTDESEFPDIRDRLILEMLYGTGMRLSELIGLRESDFNRYEKTVKVLGKRNKERIIPLPDGMVKQTQDYLKKKRDVFNSASVSYLLVTDSGNKLYPMFVYRTVKKYLGTIPTLSKKSPHVLRHTYATHLLDKGADLNAVKELLGHASLAATQVYTHNTLEKLKSAFDQAHPKA